MGAINDSRAWRAARKNTMLLSWGLGCTLLVSSCAQIVAPTGGDTDRIPPKIVSTSPSFKQLNVKTQQIVFSFDEYVRLKNIGSLAIAPPPAIDPTVKVLGKDLILEFSDPLPPNTTISIDASGVVSDLTEGNMASSARLVFSTGPSLDTGGVRGRVVDALTGQPAENVIVGVFPKDSALIGRIPTYAVPQKSNGSYSLDYVRPGDYRLIAFADANKNRRVDAEERIGLITSNINVSDSTVTMPLIRLAAPKRGPAKLLRAKQAGPGAVRVYFSNTPQALSLSGNQESVKLGPVTSDSVMFVFNNLDADSIRIPLKINAVGGKSGTDTSLTIAPRKFINDKERAAFRNPQGLEPIGRPNSLTAELKLKFYTPFGASNNQRLDSIRATFKGVKIPVKAVFDSLGILVLNFGRVGEGELVVTVPDSSLRDFYGRPNSAFSKTYNLVDPETYGTLIVSFSDTLYKPGQIVELLGSDGQLLRTATLRQGATITWAGLDAGDYRVRVLLDENQNGFFDGPDLQAFTEPERYAQQPDKLTLKSGWTVEVDISKLLTPPPR